MQYQIFPFFLQAICLFPMNKLLKERHILKQGIRLIYRIFSIGFLLKKGKNINQIKETQTEKNIFPYKTVRDS